MKAKLLTAVTFCIILLASCNKKTNQDPVLLCKSSLRDSSFKVGEYIGYPNEEKFFEADTIVASRNGVQLIANDSLADEYTWRFSSSSQVFTGRSVKVVITQPVDALTITLTVKRKPGNPCLRNLPPEIDYRKTITVVNGPTSPIFGTFKGYKASDKNKSVTIEVLPNGIKNIPFATTGSYYLQNEVLYGSSAFFIGGAGTYDPLYGAYATEGFGYLIGPGKIEIDYRYKMNQNASDFTIIKDTFYGLRQ